MLIYIYITFTFCHLAYAFIQSDLQMRIHKNNEIIYNDYINIYDIYINIDRN